MAESLNRLAELDMFTILQEKMNNWNSKFKTNTIDDNLARGCEIVELNARVQGQLFRLLSLCASEGKLYGAGASGIRSRLLPLLGQGFFASGLSSDASLSVIADAARRDREVADEVKQSYEASLKLLEEQLKESRAENEDIKAELADTKLELKMQGRASATEKMFAEAELKDLRYRLSEAESERGRLQSRADIVEDYNSQVRRLRDEIGELHLRRDIMYGHPSTPPLPPPPPPPPPSRFCVADDFPAPLQPQLESPVRRLAMIGRYSDLSASGRLAAMDGLRQVCDDQINNQKIIFAAVQECFALAKLASREFESRVRSQILRAHIGPVSLEAAVQDCVSLQRQPEDLAFMVQDVIRSLSRNYHLYLPPGIGFEVIAPLIRDLCQLAWEMAILPVPMETARCRDGDVLDEKKYRRSYDSEFSAPLVSHYIWPALVQGAEVVVKGEACTRRGAAYIRGIRRSVDSHSVSESRSESPARGRESGRSFKESTRRSSTASKSTTGAAEAASTTSHPDPHSGVIDQVG